MTGVVKRFSGKPMMHSSQSFSMIHRRMFDFALSGVARNNTPLDDCNAAAKRSGVLHLLAYSRETEWPSLERVTRENLGCRRGLPKRGLISFCRHRTAVQIGLPAFPIEDWRA